MEGGHDRPGLPRPFLSPPHLSSLRKPTGEPLLPATCHTSAQDFKLKCEIYVEFLPEEVFEFFFQQCRKLKIVQYIGPIDWLHHSDIVDVVTNNGLRDLEIFILSNTADGKMNLGVDTVEFLLDICPNLIGLGNLKTWGKIDYFDPESEYYMKSESLFIQMKKDALAKNWDIDFDLENCDFLYNNDFPS